MDARITRTALRYPVATLLAAVTACGGPDESAELADEMTPEQVEAVMEAVEPIVEEALAREEARSAARFPCTLYDQAAVSNLLAADIEAPMFTNEFKNTSDIDTGSKYSWQAAACSWNSWGDGPSMTVWVSRPEHFADGSVSCYGIYDEDVTEPLLDGQAVWTFRKSFAWARLLVCRDDALFHIEIHDGPVDEAAAKRISLEVASEIADALANLSDSS